MSSRLKELPSGKKTQVGWFEENVQEKLSVARRARRDVALSPDDIRNAILNSIREISGAYRRELFKHLHAAAQRGDVQAAPPPHVRRYYDLVVGKKVAPICSATDVPPKCSAAVRQQRAAHQLTRLQCEIVDDVDSGRLPKSCLELIGSGFGKDAEIIGRYVVFRALRKVDPSADVVHGSIKDDGDGGCDLIAGTPGEALLRPTFAVDVKTDPRCRDPHISSGRTWDLVPGNRGSVTPAPKTLPLLTLRMDAAIAGYLLAAIASPAKRPDFVPQWVDDYDDAYDFLSRIGYSGGLFLSLEEFLDLHIADLKAPAFAPLKRSFEEERKDISTSI